MATPKIISLETAHPDFAVTQSMALDCVKRKPGLNPETLRWYERFLKDKAIETRYFAVDSLEQLYRETGDEANRRFQEKAVALGRAALEKALRSARIVNTDLDALIVTTCTGYLCPGLSTYLSGEMGLRPDAKHMDLMGIGCGAALPAIQSACDFLKASPDSVAAVLCVEICSAALYWGPEIDVVLSNALFADGAAALVVTGRPGYGGPSVLEFRSLLRPEYRDHLRFRSRGSRLCNVIHPSVPDLAAEAVWRLKESFTSVDGPFDEVAVHPGGRKVLDAIEARIPEFRRRLDLSRDILRRFGNMSSPSVLFVLKNMIEKGHLQEEDTVFLYTFGAGFSAFGAALLYEPMESPRPQPEKERNHARFLR